MVVLLRGAHPAAVRALVETLLEGHAPTDPEAPCVRVCFTPHELLDAPVGARVVLVGAGQAPEWLNINRPVVRERELVLFLWVADGELEPLRRSAPDFLDWVSHRIEVPWFAPAVAVAELERALARVKWIAVAGAELVEVAAEGRRELDAKQHYDDLASAMESGDVAVRGLASDDDLWRLMLAHAEVQWCHRVVLVEPEVLPPLVWVIDARIEDWDQHATRLESLGVEHPRLVAALDSRTKLARGPLARTLTVYDVHMELIRSVAWERADDVTTKLARELGLHDVADALELDTWCDDQMTIERIERGLRSRSSFSERSGFWRYVSTVIANGIRSQPDHSETEGRGLDPEPSAATTVGARDEDRSHQEAGHPSMERAVDQVSSLLGGLLEDNGQVLRSWDPTQEPSFERYVQRWARSFAAGFRNDERGRRRSS